MILERRPSKRFSDEPPQLERASSSSDLGSNSRFKQRTRTIKEFEQAGLQQASQESHSFQEVMRALGGTKPLEDKMVEGQDVLEVMRNNREHFAEDVRRLRHRIRADTFLLLNPKGWKMQSWDVVTTMAILYTLFVTPYEIGLDLPTRFDGLLIVNQMVTFVFTVDIVVQFFLPVPDPKAVDGKLERRHRVLAARYARSWLLLDVLTCIPFDLLLLYGVLGGPVKMVRVLRVARLAKVFKVIRSSQILQRWENSMAIPSTTMQIGFWSFLAVTLLHWFACFWCLLPTLLGSQRPLPDEGGFSAFEAAIAQRMHDPKGDGSCRGCVQSDAWLVYQDPAAAAYCKATPPFGRYADCLTPCEQQVRVRPNLHHTSPGSHLH
jgi:hypothetical protein